MTAKRPPVVRWMESRSLRAVGACAMTICTVCTMALPTSCAGTPKPAASGADASPVDLYSLEDRLVIGPDAARTLGFRVAWETLPIIAPDSEFVRFEGGGDSIFVLDSKNVLTRLRKDDGNRVWQTPVGGRHDSIQGIVRVGDRVGLTADGSMIVVDAITGAQIDNQHFDRPARTAAVVASPYLVYGGRGGTIVWHEYRVGHSWRVNGTDGPILVKPLLLGDDIVAASATGSVIVMDARTARTIWTKQLLAGIVARPTGGSGMIFIASKDQYLWALAQADGHTVWKYFNDAPLVTPPTLIGDRLYQRIPSLGLCCFDAFVTDKPDGKILWSNKDVAGEVIGRSKQNLLVWDPASHTLTALDDNGAKVRAISLPQVEQIVMTAPEGGDIYAAGHDGRLERLVPQ